jgi:phage shock protein A
MDQSEYDRIKTEYKVHYQKMKELKQRVAQAKHTQRISEAIQNMDPKPVLNSVDEMVTVIREKVAQVEAKLSVAMNAAFESQAQLEEDSLSAEQRTEYEEALKKQQAKETIEKMKAQMSADHQFKTESTHTVSNPVETAKTIGPGIRNQEDSSNEEKTIKKSIGPKN